MNIVKLVLTNGFVPFIPILIWNIVFTPKLPAGYASENFNHNIPPVILILEGIFRILVFVIPVFARVNLNTPGGTKGLFIYILGSLIYYGTWLLLMYAPGSSWSRSLWGFTAPAYTPLIWLLGISLMLDAYYFKLGYSKWQYILPCIVFVFLHVLHSVLAYKH